MLARWFYPCLRALLAVKHTLFFLLCAGSKAAAGGSVTAVERSYAKVAIQWQESEVPPSKANNSTSHHSPAQHEVAQASEVASAVAGFNALRSAASA